MNDLTHELLQISAKLFQHLMTVPKNEERDAYIEKINAFLDERGVLIEKMRAAKFVFNPNESLHAILAELDKGITEHLSNILNAIKSDLKDLKNQKKNEMQYMNPYSHVQVMDGMYYDKKK